MPETVPFTSVPVNKNARKRIMRQARLGARPASVSPDYGDAMRTVDAARAYRTGWASDVTLLPVAVRNAWNNR